ncbi:MAG: DMT family transporter [Acidobacteriota bacterium]|nr:DMT family transporter [Acidobacteriota bacterium]MDH3783759.1 DMT family transporter [Acidobacteriota bacterium]
MSPDVAPYLGPTACLTTAGLWAMSVYLFRGPIELHGARSVNLMKCSIAAVLQGVTVLLLGQFHALFEAPIRSVVLIGISGIIGLTLGDTSLFAAIARLGVHRTLLLQTLSPVFAAITAALVLDEQLTPRIAVGGLVILSGVGMVVAPSRRSGSGGDWKLLGILFAVLAALGQAVGLVLAKQGMEDVAILPASFLRLGSAAIGLLLLGSAAGGLSRLRGLIGDRNSLARVAPGTLFGTYIALFLMMAGIAWSPAAVSSVLLSTGPVFSLIFDRFVVGQAITPRALAGTLLAIAGVAVVSGA